MGFFGLFRRGPADGAPRRSKRGPAQQEFDRLTGLYARAGIEAQLEASCAAATEGTEGIAVAYVDLDRLRAINEAHGFLVGDQCLREVAHRLQEYVGESGVLARLEADDFVILFRGLAGRLATGPLTEKVQALVAETIHAGDLQIVLQAYCGVANFGLDGTKPSALLAAAERAMSEQKVQARAVAPQAAPQGVPRDTAPEESA